ncbi:hypothetical protein Tco_1343233 [Tanacetum coccineum]
MDPTSSYYYSGGVRSGRGGMKEGLVVTIHFRTDGNEKKEDRRPQGLFIFRVYNYAFGVEREGSEVEEEREREGQDMIIEDIYRLREKIRDDGISLYFDDGSVPLTVHLLIMMMQSYIVLRHVKAASLMPMIFCLFVEERFIFMRYLSLEVRCG